MKVIQSYELRFAIAQCPIISIKDWLQLLNSNKNGYSAEEARILFKMALLFDRYDLAFIIDTLFNLNQQPNPIHYLTLAKQKTVLLALLCFPGLLNMNLKTELKQQLDALGSLPKFKTLSVSGQIQLKHRLTTLQSPKLWYQRLSYDLGKVEMMYQVSTESCSFEPLFSDPKRLAALIMTCHNRDTIQYFKKLYLSEENQRALCLNPTYREMCFDNPTFAFLDLLPFAKDHHEFYLSQLRGTRQFQYGIAQAYRAYLLQGKWTQANQILMQQPKNVREQLWCYHENTFGMLTDKILTPSVTENFLTTAAPSLLNIVLEYLTTQERAHLRCLSKQHRLAIPIFPDRQHLKIFMAFLAVEFVCHEKIKACQAFIKKLQNNYFKTLYLIFCLSTLCGVLSPRVGLLFPLVFAVLLLVKSRIDGRSMEMTFWQNDKNLAGISSQLEQLVELNILLREIVSINPSSRYFPVEEYNTLELFKTFDATFELASMLDNAAKNLVGNLLTPTFAQTFEKSLFNVNFTQKHRDRYRRMLITNTTAQSGIFLNVKDDLKKKAFKVYDQVDARFFSEYKLEPLQTECHQQTSVSALK